MLSLIIVLSVSIVVLAGKLHVANHKCKFYEEFLLDRKERFSRHEKDAIDNVMNK